MRGQVYLEGKWYSGQHLRVYREPRPDGPGRIRHSVLVISGPATGKTVNVGADGWRYSHSSSD